MSQATNPVSNWGDDLELSSASPETNDSVDLPLNPAGYELGNILFQGLLVAGERYREMGLLLTFMMCLIFKRKHPTAKWCLKQLGVQMVRLLSIDRGGLKHYHKFAKNALTSLKAASMRAVVGQLRKK